MDSLTSAAEYFLITFLALLPITNPFSTAPLFISLTSNLSAGARAVVAKQACTYMGAVLLVFLLAGSVVLEFFGISENGLRTAGGLIIGFIGFRMLFPPSTSHQISNVKDVEVEEKIAFTPLAVPMLSGPGSIAVVIGLSAEVKTELLGDGRILSYAFVGLGIILMAIFSWLVLRASGSVVRFLGHSGIDGLNRIMGFFLICIGLEFLANGLYGFVLATSL
jgi:multiple antibiotic resistance protein